MNQLYPLKFGPIIKDPIWGGKKLKTILNKEKATNNSGESWEISGVEGNISVVSNGFLAGNELTEVIEVYMGDLVGQKVFEQFGTNFPLLIKFIDACDDLSIQVHPNDEVAKERHNSYGKTEMWYVMQADEEAKLIAGFNQDVDKETYVKKLQDKALLDILNQSEVKAGDVFFMPAGRIHAIGKGILLAEIQQTSNITYRVYDYSRTDAEGNERELHTELAVDVIDYKHYDNYKTTYQPELNKPVSLADCQYFTTNVLDLEKEIERDMNSLDSFIIYMGIDGDSEIIYHENKVEKIKKGETVLVPAELAQYFIRPKGNAKLLEIYIDLNKKENED